MNIFVGNLSFDATQADMKKIFLAFGNVASAVIVMDKKGVNSRGFGFVEMPDDLQAQEAIAALNGKEFMGRPLNVSIARPKTDEEREIEKEEKVQAKLKTQAQLDAHQDKIQKAAWFESVINKKGGYKGGRRTRSYALKAVSKSKEELKPWGKPKPWQKSFAKPKPWKKPEGQAKPWMKAEGASRPWKKPEGESNPWQKPEGKAKPWKKAEGASRPWKRPEGESKPWQKPEGKPKPWRKAEGESRSPRKTGGYKR